MIISSFTTRILRVFVSALGSLFAQKMGLLS